ncbi:putative F-box/LRR-repeat/kelch-repeat protein [Corchorus olitorius]|uniref:F-box/LRR-repeat/kelch-repeat protein n=1 Tax=Corchorus olitorius TaxID=93759 RepID=A0A1R3KPZ8_9ROSI|nr:putative F-box/LRR-repeat/kelch-repeat protein [Corchorus olitorius]
MLTELMRSFDLSPFLSCHLLLLFVIGPLGNDPRVVVTSVHCNSCPEISLCLCLFLQLYTDVAILMLTRPLMSECHWLKACAFNVLKCASLCMPYSGNVIICCFVALLYLHEIIPCIL